MLDETRADTGEANSLSRSSKGCTSTLCRWPSPVPSLGFALELTPLKHIGTIDGKSLGERGPLEDRSHDTVAGSRLGNVASPPPGAIKR